MQLFKLAGTQVIKKEEILPSTLPFPYQRKIGHHITYVMSNETLASVSYSTHPAVLISLVDNGIINLLNIVYSNMIYPVIPAAVTGMDITAVSDGLVY